MSGSPMSGPLLARVATLEVRVTLSSRQSPMEGGSLLVSNSASACLNASMLGLFVDCGFLLPGGVEGIEAVGLAAIQGDCDALVQLDPVVGVVGASPRERAWC